MDDAGMQLIRPNARCRAFTAMELIVIMVVLVLLVGLLVPALRRAKSRAEQITCNGYLKSVGLAVHIWSGDHNGRNPMQLFTNVDGSPKFADASNLFRYFQAMSNELSTPFILACPADKQRSPATGFGPVFGNTNVSYFIGLDADENNPYAFLAGDRNLTNGQPLQNGSLTLVTNQPTGWTKAIHNEYGNLGIADGSVLSLSSEQLEALTDTRTNANRLLFP